MSGHHMLSKLNMTVIAAAAVLDAPMSMMWAVQQAKQAFPDQHASSSHYVVHYIGMQL